MANETKPKEVSGKAVIATGLLVGGAWAVMHFDACGRHGASSSPAPSAAAWNKVPDADLAAARVARATAQPASPPTEREIAARLGEPYIEPAPVVRPALKGSRAAFCAWFEPLGVAFKSTPLADGTPRQWGTNASKLIQVEATGYGDRLESAALIIAVEGSDPDVIVSASTALIVFMRETGWASGKDWALAEIKKGKGAKKTRGSVDYELTTVVPGLFVVSAKPTAA